MARRIGRMGEEWQLLERLSDMPAIFAAFGLPHPVDPQGPHMPASLALLELGLCSCRVVLEARVRRSHKKVARDADLERDTMHGAPTWRPAMEGEPGTMALILPVGEDMHGAVTLSISMLGDAAFPEMIADLIAIPLDGARPMSRTGHTLAIGSFRAAQGKLTLRGNGKAWLDAYLAEAREVFHALPPSERDMDFNFPDPEYHATLLLEPLALEWRITHPSCVVPHDALQVICPDSRALAEKLDRLMRRKERLRAVPPVLGPKIEAVA